MGFMNWLRGSPLPSESVQDHLSQDEVDMLVVDDAIEKEAAERLAQEAYSQHGALPDHPDISADAFLAWHAQITAAQRNATEYGLSVFEDVPPPEPGTRAYDEQFGPSEPKPEVVAGTPPTLLDMLRGTQDVWVSWIRDRKRS